MEAGLIFLEKKRSNLRQEIIKVIDVVINNKYKNRKDIDLALTVPFLDSSIIIGNKSRNRNSFPTWSRYHKTLFDSKVFHPYFHRKQCIGG